MTLSKLRINMAEKGRQILDALSERSGLVVMPDRLIHPRTPDAVTLDIPGYRQLNTFSCGATAGLMVLHTYRPKASIKRFYRLVKPDPMNGTEPKQLINALRQSGIGVQKHLSLKWLDIKNTIDSGFPVITTVRTKRKDVHHWVVIYGVGIRPNRVYLAANGFPWIARRAYPWKDFRSLWHPNGNGLVCWGQ